MKFRGENELRGLKQTKHFYNQKPEKSILFALQDILAHNPS